MTVYGNWSEVGGGGRVTNTSFVILSSNEAPLLVHSLAAAVSEGFDDGLVIDNASTDSTAAIAELHDVRRLVLPHRVPYTEAMNAGLRAAGGEAVAMLQADTFLAPGYLVACRAALARNPAVGSVAPKLVRTRGPQERDELPLLDAAAMGFDRRRKNNLVGHGDSAWDSGLVCPSGRTAYSSGCYPSSAFPWTISSSQGVPPFRNRSTSSYSRGRASAIRSARPGPSLGILLGPRESLLHVGPLLLGLPHLALRLLSPESTAVHSPPHGTS